MSVYDMLALIKAVLAGGQAALPAIVLSDFYQLNIRRPFPDAQNKPTCLVRQDLCYTQLAFLLESVLIMIVITISHATLHNSEHCR